MAKTSVRLSDLRALPPSEVREQVDGLRQELWRHRIKIKQGSSQQTHRVRELRRDIARRLGVLNERKAAR
ncbi:MAG TPA: 50S ribosomal protein L29 [bacterium]